MTEQNSNKIRAYFLDNLSEEEAHAFLKEIENDSALKEQFEIEKQLFNQLGHQFHEFKIPSNTETEDLKTFLKSEEAKKIKKRIQKAHQEYQQTSKKPRRRIWYVAASIVLLLGLASTQFFNTGVSEEDLFEEFYSTSDLPSLTTRGDADFLSTGIKAFLNADYQKAISNFESHLQNEVTPNPEIYLYLGASYQELGNKEKTIASYDALINSNALNKNKGYWFKAMTHLKYGDVERAKTQLKKLVESNNSTFKHKEAKEILSALE